MLLPFQVALLSAPSSLLRSMKTADGSYFECLGPDNHPPQYPIYLVPDVENVSLGPVPIFIIHVWDQSQSPLLMSGTGPRETFCMAGTR